MNFKENLTKMLFDTNAIRVCPEDKPFWYTSGTIGPYFVNTHFLFGNETKANKFLGEINELIDNKEKCPLEILKISRENYETDIVYKNVINYMLEYIGESVDVSSIDYMSGGERRDWFFSNILADILNKPHISIFKDLDTLVSIKQEVYKVNNIEGKNVLHIADLITEASSYMRAWVPAIKDLGGNIKWSFVVVDRMQGGQELLKTMKIESYNMISIDKELFNIAKNSKIINQEQLEMVSKYIENPKETMIEFLKENPRFLKDSLSSDEKTIERVKLCLDNNVYGINVD